MCLFVCLCVCAGGQPSDTGVLTSEDGAVVMEVSRRNALQNAYSSLQHVVTYHVCVCPRVCVYVCVCTSVYVCRFCLSRSLLKMHCSLNMWVSTGADSE